MEVNDILNSLTKEKETLAEEIQEKQKRMDEIDTTIKTLRGVLNVVEVVCPECNGEGKKFHRSCAEDEGDYCTCNKCKGTGKVSAYSK
jgi:predicted nuclease with TOPRIM domain